MIGLWSKGLIARRLGRLLGAMVGVALTIALLGSLGAFVVSASASMTARAITNVPVDWQVQLVPGTDPHPIEKALGQAARYAALQEVGYADTAGFVATTNGTTQTTGPGKVLGLEPTYRGDFPGQLRLLLGSWDGVLIAEQTAANLHVTIGDMMTIDRVGQAGADVRVAGVVALPMPTRCSRRRGFPRAPPHKRRPITCC